MGRELGRHTRFPNSCESEIKFDIPDSTKDNPLQIFEILWTKEITNMIVSYTNN